MTIFEEEDFESPTIVGLHKKVTFKNPQSRHFDGDKPKIMLSLASRKSSQKSLSSIIINDKTTRSNHDDNDFVGLEV